MSATRRLINQIGGLLGQLQRAVKGEDPTPIQLKAKQRTMEQIQRDYALACNEYGHLSFGLEREKAKVTQLMERMAALTAEGQQAAMREQAEKNKAAEKSDMKADPEERESEQAPTAEQMTP